MTLAAAVVVIVIAMLIAAGRIVSAIGEANKALREEVHDLAMDVSLIHSDLKDIRRRIAPE